MNKIPVDTWSGGLWFLLALYVGVESVRLGVGEASNPGPGFILFWSALVLAGLSLSVLFRSLIRPPETGAAPEEAHWFRIGSALGAVGLYILLFERVGFLLTTVVMIGVMLRLGGVTQWIRIAAVAVGVTLGTYILLQLWLQTRLPPGALRWLDTILVLER